MCDFSPEISCIFALHAQATEEDYEKVPIEQFGLAMLRGMGWTDGNGVGRTQRYLYFRFLCARSNVMKYCFVTCNGTFMTSSSD